MNNILTDSEKIVRKFLQERYVIKDEPFTVERFDAMEGEHYLVKVEKNDKIEFFGTVDVAMIKHSYLCINGKDYEKWRNIYLRKYKLIKIKNNVKIQ